MFQKWFVKTGTKACGITNSQTPKEGDLFLYHPFGILISRSLIFYNHISLSGLNAKLPAKVRVPRLVRGDEGAAVGSRESGVHRILRIGSFPPRLRVPVCRQAGLR